MSEREPMPGFEYTGCCKDGCAKCDPANQPPTADTDAEPQEPIETGNHGAWTYRGRVWSKAAAFDWYRRDHAAWARTELTAARTRIAEAEGEIEQLTQVAESVQCFIDDALEARAERDAARATAARLREVLADINTSRHMTRHECPVCGYYDCDSSCRLAAALATTDTDSTGGETT